MKLPSNDALKNIYGECENSSLRFKRLSEAFTMNFAHDDAEYFSAPGRTEIIGNHTDHNGGMVIAAAIDMDTVAAAAPNSSDIIHIVSEGYSDEVTVSLNNIRECKAKDHTSALVGGICEAVIKHGFHVSGFDACISTTVISSAGVSSSASFEMLICSIINYFFNGSSMEFTDYARIGQYAENVYWDKASGLLDQMACAAGGAILLDFSDKDNISCRKLDLSSLNAAGFMPVIVNTGKGHADMGRQYSDIPLEMKAVANALGADRLCETDMDTLLSKLHEINNDRAVLRAMHFFSENERVQRAAKAISDGDIPLLLELIEASGNSSWELLQNCFCPDNTAEQKIPLFLALTRRFLDSTGSGVCRVHGGGFAGTIICILPKSCCEDYINYISGFAGRENVYPVNIRSTGATHIPGETN